MRTRFNRLFCNRFAGLLRCDLACFLRASIGSRLAGQLGASLVKPVDLVCRADSCTHRVALWCLRSRRRGRNGLHLEEALILRSSAAAHHVTLNAKPARQADTAAVFLRCGLVVEPIPGNARAHGRPDGVLRHRCGIGLLVRLRVIHATQARCGVTHLRGGLVRLAGEGAHRILRDVELIVVGLLPGGVLASGEPCGVIQLGSAQRASKARIVRIDAHRHEVARRRRTLLRVGRTHVGGSAGGLSLGIARVEDLLGFIDIGLDCTRQIRLGLLAQEAGRFGLFFVKLFQVVVLGRLSAASLVEPAQTIGTVAVVFVNHHVGVSRMAT